MWELTIILRQAGKSIAGPDNIPNWFLKNFPVIGLMFLLELYNHVWTKQVFPDSREEAIITTVLWSNPSTKIDRWRPIVIKCSMCRIFEAISCKS